MFLTSFTRPRKGAWIRSCPTVSEQTFNLRTPIRIRDFPVKRITP